MQQDTAMRSCAAQSRGLVLFERVAMGFGVFLVLALVAGHGEAISAGKLHRGHGALER
jgi:hypothetical protein